MFFAGPLNKKRDHLRFLGPNLMTENNFFGGNAVALKAQGQSGQKYRDRHT